MTAELLCPWESPVFLFFSSNVPSLVHYSHAVAFVTLLVFCSFIFFSNTRSLVGRLVFWFSVTLSLWIFIDVILWSTNRPDLVMFGWSLQILLEPIVYALIFYILYTYFRQSFPGIYLNIFIALLLLPIILLLPTSLTVVDLPLSYCEATEGFLASHYSYFVNLTLLGLAVIYSIIFIKQTRVTNKYRAGLYLLSAFTLFALTFTGFNIVSTITGDWTLSQYGLFSIPIFALLLGYAIIEFNAFNGRQFSVKLIVLALWLSVGSLLFIVQSDVGRIITFFTLAFTILTGYFLIKSVSKEIEQKRLAQSLATELAGVNMRLERLDKMKSEFVSIASHQLRSPLTSVRGYISMIIEGSYGEVNPKVKEVLTHVSDASRHMALSIEDYLNVSRIEAGNMKYEIADYDLKKLANEVVVELVPVAEKKGIKLEFKPATEEGVAVKLDIGKSRQIVQNLIDNALKYTKDTGTITVVVRKDIQAKKAYVDVIDQGIGISPEGLKTLFQKFERAKNANEINVTGTGLGLYIARTMANGMGGDITVASEGEGKGSTFTFVMPLNGIEAKWN